MRTRLVVLITFFLLLPFAAAADYRRAVEAHDDKDYASAAAEFEALGELGYARASYRLGLMLEQGRGMPADPVRAYAWHGLAVQQGEPDALRAQRRVAKKLDESELSAARQGAAELTDRFGVAALEVTLIPVDSGRRLREPILLEPPEMDLTRPFRYGEGAAVIDLEFDVSAEGVARDYQLVRPAPEAYVREVISYLQQARRHSVIDQYAVHLRIVYSFKSRDEQYGQARLLRKLQRRAETGSPYRKYYYAYAQELSEAFGNKYSAKDSNAWYLRAAQGGYAKAQYMIGRRLYQGDTFTQDVVKGVRWLQHAAARGDAPAAYFLARRADAMGDVDEAGDYMDQAARLGHTTAMLRVAATAAQQGDMPLAEQYLTDAQAHLDRVTWEETAALVYARDNPAKALEHQRAALREATAAGLPTAALQEKLLDLQQG